MPEEVTKEIAATGESPGGGPPRNLASPEFFFLLQRIDRLEEKLTGEIKAVDEKFSARFDSLEGKLSGRIDSLEGKFSGRIDRLETEMRQEMTGFRREISGMRFWIISAVITIIAGFAGTIVTLVLR